MNTVTIAPKRTNASLLTTVILILFLIIVSLEIQLTSKSRKAMLPMRHIDEPPKNASRLTLIIIGVLATILLLSANVPFNFGTQLDEITDLTSDIISKVDYDVLKMKEESNEFYLYSPQIDQDGNLDSSCTCGNIKIIGSLI